MSARVLIVDDLPQNVKLLEAKLSSEYYEIATALSGQEAIEKVKNFSPDVILLDIMMPGMDGFQVCQTLKADVDTAHIPVVMITALSEVSDRIKGLECGADDFITKPINDTHMMARVKSLIRLKQITDELHMRDKTSNELGIVENNFDFRKNYSGNVVVINDDVVENKRINEKLTALGHIIKSYDDAGKGLDEVIGNMCDLAIVNVQIGDVDGLRICSQIRNNQRTRNTPILIILDNDDKKLLAKSFELGINDYLVSPIDQNELVARVKTQMCRKKYQDALRSNFQQTVSMVVVDSLTKLYNRRYLDAHLKNIAAQALAKGKALSVMTLDIDYFKKINDGPGLGHHIGDEVLVQIAERILNSLRSTDLATRPGGEEFVIVMPGTDLKSAKEVAERLRFAVASVPFKISAAPNALNVTASIGVTCLRKNESSEDMLKRSDEALYKAKNEGRNKVIALD